VTPPDKHSLDASELTGARSEAMVEGVRAPLWMNGGASRNRIVTIAGKAGLVSPRSPTRRR
jgi:hypothetical protein